MGKGKVKDKDSGKRTDKRMSRGGEDKEVEGEEEESKGQKIKEGDQTRVNGDKCREELVGRSKETEQRDEWVRKERTE